MAWETRRGKGRYFSKTVRIGQKTKKIYFGTGVAGESAAQMVALNRENRRAQRALRDAELLRLTTADQAIDQFRHMADTLAKATLILAGHHEHRGEWRLSDEHSGH